MLNREQVAKKYNLQNDKGNQYRALKIQWLVPPAAGFAAIEKMDNYHVQADKTEDIEKKLRRGAEQRLRTAGNPVEKPHDCIKVDHRPTQKYSIHYRL